jgi:fibronectin-binding autotransporter adhesin
MKKFWILTALVAAAFPTMSANAQTSYTSNSAATAWNAARWNNSADAAPYTSTFTANNAVNFTSGTYSFAGMGATVNVGNVTVADGVTVNFASIGSTYATGGLVRTINVGANGLFDLNGNSVSTAAGTGLIKSGAGVFGTGGGAFTGGFTINAGTVVARATTGMGSGATNTLTLNGGTVASNNDRDFATTRFGGGIAIGGNVQFGALSTNVSIANSSANLSFANNVSLGGANRTLTLGNNGNQTFSGVIANTGTGGITFAANAGTDGRFEITNAANTFTGDININGGEVRFTTDGSMGNFANDIIIDGGRFGKASDATTVTLGAGRSISVGDGIGTSISSAGSGTLVYNGVIANKSGEIGSWAKQGGGVLELGGVSAYTGSTAINNGILRLTTGNDRLPTGTVVSLGQAASANLGTLDLNGRNQEIAGLSSTSGTNAGTNTNEVNSVAAATLTINTAAATSYTYSDGTAANSGVISGAISLVKVGGGTQILGGTNTYTGGTTVSGGTLTLGHATNTLANAGAVTVSGGTLALGTNSDTVGAVTLSSGSITSTTGVLTGSSYSLTNTGSISARLGGSGALTKTGAGTATLSGANTYSGGTTVNAGVLVVTAFGSLGTSGSDISVAASGELRVNGGVTGKDINIAGSLTGSGFITGTVNVLDGGKIAAGNSLGELSVTGDVDFTSGSIFDVQIDASSMPLDSDTLVVSGTLNLLSGSLLNLATINNSAVALNETVTIAQFGSRTGFFSNYANGSTFSDGLNIWQINYGTNAITLTAVPEPSAFLLVGSVLALAAGRRRRA